MTLTNIQLVGVPLDSILAFIESEFRFPMPKGVSVASVLYNEAEKQVVFSLRTPTTKPGFAEGSVKRLVNPPYDGSPRPPAPSGSLPKSKDPKETT